LCEQYIDYKLEESQIRAVRDLIDSVELPVSTEDVLLGYFLGAADSQLRNFTMTVYNRAPEKEENEYFQEILVRRTPEIIARIINLTPFDEGEDDLMALVEGDEKISEDELQEILLDEPEEIEPETDEPIVSEIELSPVATIDASEGSVESMKFSFKSRSVKKPVATVLGIPVKK
jgi:hypothetical protein